MDNNLSRKTRSLNSTKANFSLTSWRGCGRHHYHKEIVAMALILFKIWIIVGPTITGEGADIMNQLAMKAAAESFLCTQSIMLHGEPWASAQRSRVSIKYRLGGHGAGSKPQLSAHGLSLEPSLTARTPGQLYSTRDASTLGALCSKPFVARLSDLRIVKQRLSSLTLLAPCSLPCDEHPP